MNKNSEKEFRNELLQTSLGQIQKVFKNELKRVRTVMFFWVPTINIPADTDVKILNILEEDYQRWE